MRSPAAAFDLGAALAKEIRDALAAINTPHLTTRIVHRCRVHIKRARALARVGADCAPGLSSVFNETGREVMHALSEARELAALATSAKEAAALQKRKRAARALKQVAKNLKAAKEALGPLPLEAVRKGLRDLLALSQVWPAASPRQIERGADRIARRARRARREGEDARKAARRHHWRKREKDRFFAAEILGESWPKERRRRSKKGEKLGDALGHERDNLLLIARIEAQPALAGDLPTALMALQALEKRREPLAARADAIGAKLHSGGA
jgi:CHAD domain-containing protein